MEAHGDRQTTEAAISDRWVFLLGGVAAIAGSIMGMVGNLIHPATPLRDPEGVARTIAQSDAWTLIHLAIVVGIVLMLGGLVALVRSIDGGMAGALARLGLAAAIVGIAIGVVLVILDGVAAKQLADQWASAPQDERATALRIVLANETINFALASSFNIVFAGATFILLGLAVAFSRTYRPWLGWVVVVAGVVSVGAGLIQALTGEPTAWSRVLTIIGPTVITLWLLVIGILLVRKAGRTRSGRLRRPGPKPAMGEASGPRRGNPGPPRFREEQRMRGPLGFIKVRTEVDDHHLRVRLSSVLTPLSRQVPLDRVRGVETHDDLSRHIPGTLRFWLVGVRIVPGVGWAISAGRRRGVTLSLDDGRRAVLGSRRPEALADAVRRGSR